MELPIYTLWNDPSLERYAFVPFCVRNSIIIHGICAKIIFVEQWKF